MLQKFKDQNIPVIGSTPASTATSPSRPRRRDNVKAARARGGQAGRGHRRLGKVGVIVHDQTSRTDRRRDGFINEMKAKYPNIEIVGPQYGAGDQLKSSGPGQGHEPGQPGHKGFFGAERDRRLA